MTDCYTCRVLRSQLERARREKLFDLVLNISNEMARHYSDYHQQRGEAENTKPVDGLAAQLWPGAREAK